MLNSLRHRLTSLFSYVSQQFTFSNLIRLLNLIPKSLYTRLTASTFTHVASAAVTIMLAYAFSLHTFFIGNSKLAECISPNQNFFFSPEWALVAVTTIATVACSVGLLMRIFAPEPSLV